MLFQVSGISYLHRQGIVHRDIKADNILIGQEGVAKLCDFGISCQEGELGEGHGTRQYMSPELVGAIVCLPQSSLICPTSTHRRPCQLIVATTFGRSAFSSSCSSRRGFPGMLPSAGTRSTTTIGVQSEKGFCRGSRYHLLL